MTLNTEDVVSVWNRLPKWAQSALYALDRRLNAKTGGDPTETVSLRLAKSRDRGEWEGRIGCALLDRYDPGHCDRA